MTALASHEKTFIGRAVVFTGVYKYWAGVVFERELAQAKQSGAGPRANLKLAVTGDEVSWRTPGAAYLIRNKQRPWKQAAAADPLS